MTRSPLEKSRTASENRAAKIAWAQKHGVSTKASRKGLATQYDYLGDCTQRSSNPGIAVVVIMIILLIAFALGEQMHHHHK